MSDPQVSLKPTCYYHIYNHSVGKENLFMRDADYIYFLQKMKEHVLPFTEIISYCLMPNHFHLVVRMKSHEEIESAIKLKIPAQQFESKRANDENYTSNQIGKAFSNLFNTYAKHYNFVNGRTGTLFKRTFRRKEIEDISYLRRLICYVHQNPLAAGFATDLRSWKYSSYEAVTTIKNTLVQRETAIELFGDLENLIYCHQKMEEISIG
jgi:putative transposase